MLQFRPERKIYPFTKIKPKAVCNIKKLGLDIALNSIR